MKQSAPQGTSAAADAFDRLIDRYAAAGLFDSPARTPLAMALLGPEAGRRLAADALVVDALVRNVLGGQPAGPPQIAVFGGNNVGKSSIANLLMGTERATVHHLGAATRHAHAFLPPGMSAGALFEERPLAFQRFRIVPAGELRPDHPDEFAVSLASADTAAATDAVVWDVPDCDSVHAPRYLAAVVEAATVVDAVVAVTTQEKYAVEGILQLLATLMAAGVPAVGVLNKALPAHQDELTRHAAEQLAIVADRLDLEIPPIEMFALPYGDLSLGVGDRETAETVARLRSTALAAARTIGDRRTAAACFIDCRLPSVLEPARREVETRAQWTAAITAAEEQFVAAFEQHYLNDPARFDAFHLLGLRLLELLNPPVPGLQEAIRFVRRALSLPAQAVILVGKVLWRLIGGDREKEQRAKVPPVLATSAEANAAVIRELRRLIRAEVRQGRHHPFWDALDAASDDESERLRLEFQTQIDRFWRQMHERINAAAEDIFHQLEHNPWALNALRSSRLAVEVAAIVVGVAIPGKGGFAADLATDLVAIPALLTLVEAASRGIADQFVEARKDELRQALKCDAEQFATSLYGDRLREIGERAFGTSGALGVDGALLAEIEERVGAWIRPKAAAR
ncbi:MAG: GTPase [Dehalococcoidia bacterium]